MPLPPLFVSHGSPMLALAPGRTGAAWRALGAELPRPRAILVASAHWLTAEPRLSDGPQPETLHDFGGFSPALDRLRYPAPGAPALARAAAAALVADGFAAQTVPRGLDHGAWVPLRELYPAADIPVFQLSLQAQRGPAHHWRLGAALRDWLRAGEVLLLASGSLTHNLREVQFDERDAPATPYVSAFQDWMREHLEQGDAPAVLDYRRQAPEAVRAHPTEEHLLPLFVALGAAAAGARARRIDSGVTHGVLAMDAYVFETAAAPRP